MLTAKPKTSLEITLATLKGLMNESKIGVVSLSKVDADIVPAALKIRGIPRIVAVGAEVLLFRAATLSNGSTEEHSELNISIIA